MMKRPIHFSCQEFYKQSQPETDLAGAWPFSPAITLPTAFFSGEGIQEQQKQKSTEPVIVVAPRREWLQDKMSPLEDFAQSYAHDCSAGQSIWLRFRRRQTPAHNTVSGIPHENLSHKTLCIGCQSQRNQNIPKFKHIPKFKITKFLGFIQCFFHPQISQENIITVFIQMATLRHGKGTYPKNQIQQQRDKGDKIQLSEVGAQINIQASDPPSS